MNITEITSHENELKKETISESDNEYSETEIENESEYSELQGLGYIFYFNILKIASKRIFFVYKRKKYNKLYYL